MPGRNSWPVIGFAVAMLTVLIAQFMLDGPADTIAVVHWIQHGLIFGGGLGAGLALAGLRRMSQVRA
ncbi:hypothetical protein EPN29_11115 [bacterium]|nr:MAG: hypothetical protein EPN29_11115 [bacterium]